MGKSFASFAQLGQCVTMADETSNPTKLRMPFWNDGELHHDYVTDGMEHRGPKLIEFASRIMALHAGALIAYGTTMRSSGAFQHKKFREIYLEKIGRMRVHMREPLKRKWERSVFISL